MIHAIVLAAGASERMGTQKLLLPYAGGTIIEHVVAHIEASEVQGITVVVGRDAEAIERRLAGRRVSFVRNPRPGSEMLHSIRCGLAALPSFSQGILIALGDQVRIDAALINELIRAFRASPEKIVVPVYKGKRGHPILIPAHFRREIAAHYEGEGLKGLLRTHPEAVLPYSVQRDAVLLDIDSPEDYRAELRRLREEGIR